MPPIREILDPLTTTSDPIEAAIQDATEWHNKIKKKSQPAETLGEMGDVLAEQVARKIVTSLKKHLDAQLNSMNGWIHAENLILVALLNQGGPVTGADVCVYYGKATPSSKKMPPIHLTTMSDEIEEAISQDVIKPMTSCRPQPAAATPGPPQVGAAAAAIAPPLLGRVRPQPAGAPPGPPQVGRSMPIAAAAAMEPRLVGMSRPVPIPAPPGPPQVGRSMPIAAAAAMEPRFVGQSRPVPIPAPPGPPQFLSNY
ncbi:hypothetical protein DAPPUDRAFT_246321 [Daphnia pulex]|uniref:Uncharacterized protein n=1 Tax=Daphnia pulex TaxID=6669 RepID=E9GQ27_DAPPU|nr:hypothetical protein DAPPUDRAFT_246321 [Daphnia pulex]|eukprot:EFX78488.1 hypothetical protein DAPPUDRAFT_246321 [Daphnia pulex]